MDQIKIEETCSVLESIAKGYPIGTPENKAIELAANALLFIFEKRQIDQFIATMKAWAEPDRRTEEEHLADLAAQRAEARRMFNEKK